MTGEVELDAASRRRARGSAASVRARALLVLALALGAESARAEIDLSIVRKGDSYLKPTLQIDTGLFFESNAWFGESRENAGDHVGFWGEFGVMPGLEGALALGELGTLRARVSGVWTTTQFGLDAAGSNFDDRHPNQLTLEDAYLGWSSGDLFPSLGKDAIDLSVGSQKYQVGSGFLFWDGATDGGSERGGYWIAMREAFELTAIARLQTGPFLGEVVYLRPNLEPDSDTDIAGVNMEWRFGERAHLGAGYWYFAASDDFRRDGLDVFDLRGEVHPLARLPGLVFSAELVYEKNGDLNESWGGYAELGHGFEDAPGEPYLSYRFASFTGDRGGGGQIEAFDPLFYASSDWSSWYLGEILGEFIGTNRNLDAHVLRLRADPLPSWTLNLVGLVFRLDELATELQPRIFDPRVVDIRDKHLGYEVDLCVDWEMNDHVTWSAVIGALVPSNGLEQGTGGDSVWTHFMLYGSLSF
jgi:hypothetical protein